MSMICIGMIRRFPVGSLRICTSLEVPQNTDSRRRSTDTLPYGSRTFIHCFEVISLSLFSSRLDLPPYSSSRMIHFFVIKISSSLPPSIFDSANRGWRDCGSK